MAGVAFGSCLEGQDVVARAAGGVRNRGRRSTLAMPLRNRGRRSTLAMPLPKSWQAQHSVHLGACLCGRGRIRQLSRGTGCCRARGGGCAKSWQAQHFGDAVAKLWQAQHFGDPKSWQAQHSVHLGVCLCGRGRIRQLSRGTGCCRARGGGCAKSWQAQHFGDAVAKSWQAQHFGDAVAEVVAGAAFCASGCSVIASIQGAHGTCVWTFGKNIACGVIRSFNCCCFSFAGGGGGAGGGLLLGGGQKPVIHPSGPRLEGPAQEPLPRESVLQLLHLPKPIRIRAKDADETCNEPEQKPEQLWFP